jgi:hypothetical protein
MTTTADEYTKVTMRLAQLAAEDQSAMDAGLYEIAFKLQEEIGPLHEKASDLYRQLGAEYAKRMGG